MPFKPFVYCDAQLHIGSHDIFFTFDKKSHGYTIKTSLAVSCNILISAMLC